MNMTHLGRGAAAIVLPAFLFACGGSGGGGGGGEPPVSSQFSVVEDNDTAEANGINSIVHASDGTIYAIGFSDQADQRTVILSYNADGSVNSSFGTNGVLTLNVKQAGTGMGTVSSGDEQGFGIVELADGDLVFTATAADGNGTADVDEGQSIYLFRLDADSNFDVVMDFGDDGGSNGLLAGAQEVVFGTPNVSNSAYQTAVGIFPSDFTTDLLLDSSGSEARLVVFGGGSAPMSANATDQDRYVTRVMADDGMVDMSFNSGVAHQFSTPRNGNSGDNVRHGFVEEDGDIMSAGYTNLGDGLGNHIILIKLLEDGSEDASFGDFIFPANGPAGIARPGVAVFNPFREAAGFAEAYGAVRQSNGDYITTGYGAANNGTVPDSGPFSVYAPNEQQDVVTFRVAGGTQLDTSYGNPDAGNGTQAIQSEDDATFAGDVEADLLRPEERGRNLVLLPDDRSIHVGYFGGVPALYLFTADGQLDTEADDDGIFVLPHDDVTNSSGPVLQQFFAAELSADGSTLAVGTRATDDAGARVVVIDTGIE